MDTLTDVNFVFTTIDYVVLIVMLVISALIGVYFGFFGKGANTTDEYLLGGKRMKTIPIALSLVASQLSGIAIMTIPSEMYSYGINYFFGVIGMLVAVFIINYIYIPLFYNNNIDNCYEYLELRFCKNTRKVVTVAYLLNVILVIPVYIFIPSLAFSQVTGFNIHIINGVVCTVCIFYTMLGGIKAVVWTDVVQASVMLLSCVLVLVFGIKKVGGISEVLSRANDGERLTIDMTFDLQARSTFWNNFLGGIVLWSGYVGLYQSCVQRLVALPSLNHARRSIMIFAIGFLVIMFSTCLTGLVMYSRYYKCDPVEAGFVEKPDKLMPFFVQDVVGHLRGMPGLFISCVFSAALSSMSANLNTLSGIVYFDYIKPFVNHTEKKANIIMRSVVVLVGLYCVAGGLVVGNFKSILQMAITVAGISKGIIIGVFTLGMLFPKVHAKAAFYGGVSSMCIMAWIIIGSQIAIGNGDLKYPPLPSRLEDCSILNITTPKPMSSFTNTDNSISDDSFSIYKISFNWYILMGSIFTWVIGITLSYILQGDENKKFDIKLISPVAHCLVPKRFRHVEIPLHDVSKKPNTQHDVSTAEKNLL